MRKLGVMAGALAAFIGILVSNAEANPRNRHMIEVGAGAESAITQGGMNVLLRIGYGLRQTPDSSEPGDILGPEQLVWAHITGDLAFNPNATGLNALPFLDIRFIPVHNQLAVIGEDGNSVMGDLQLLPIQVKRDIRLDRALSVTASVVGIQFGTVRAQSEKVALFAQLAVDAVGYKMASHVSSLGTFHGFHLAGLGGEVGVAFTISENFTVRIALGGTADINFGGNRGDGFAVQSDMNSYLAIKADIAKFIQLFIRGGYNAACNSVHGCEGGAQILFGATFIF